MKRMTPIGRRGRALLLLAATATVPWLVDAQPAGKAPKATPAELPRPTWAKGFTGPADLRFDQVLAEPIVRQPISMSFDERGRLWVVQYLQYPHPAGLKILSRDTFWRIVYDKIPPPPPNHFRGKDMITIHEDTRGNGVFDKHTVFLDGLNIATSAVCGRGGVWVLNPPYLLFYPVKDNADTPAGDPVVHLQGFGLEDTHSCANSLRWGPDGWLYATHGSTVTAHITAGEPSRVGVKPIQMIGQHVWRYHPEKKRFEIFAEGGGNAFGVEIDDLGRVYSGSNGGNTRGFYYVQGGAYRKGFAKHGVLANPFSFGFFEAMKNNQSPRFSHTFVINEADGLPERYRDKLFALEPLRNRVTLSELNPDRSSRQTKDHGAVVSSSDTSFRPVDIKPGPDGSLYVADFYEANIGHPSHNEGIVDRDTGRIYRLAARDMKPRKAVDLSRKTSAELIDLLSSDNRWQRQMVQRLLGDRKDQSIIPSLARMLSESKGQLALEALWALNNSSGFDGTVAEKAIEHPEPQVRAWAVRLLADDHQLGAKIAARVADLARTESNVHVRSQWASSAKRLSAAEGLPIVRGLLAHDEDAADIHVPLLLWWAIEAQCGEDRDKVLDLFRESSLWRTAIVEETIVSRLMRRFAMAGTQKDYATCIELFRLAPEKKHGLMLLSGFEEAFQGRSVAGLPDELLAEIAKLGGGSIAFGVRQGKKDAVEMALGLLRNPKTPIDKRIELIDIFGEAKQQRCVAPLLALLAAREPPAVHKAVLGALQSYADDEIGAAVVKLLPAMPADVREVAESLLVGRRTWSRQLLTAVDDGKIQAKTLPLATLRKLLLHRDEAITARVRKHWGEVKGATTTQMRHDIDRLAVVANNGKGDPYAGKKLYTARCANCHTLHASGGFVGPDLTPFKRDDAAFLLLHIINPSAEIREGYESSVVTTESGRTLTGIVIEKDSRVVVLRSADGQRMVLPKDDIAEMSVTGISLMPEGLLQGLSDQEVRDLFAYLRSGQPLNERK